MNKCKVYLAGPMSGIPQFNFPAFEVVAKMLRAHGWDAISPHECDSPETQKMAWASEDGKVIEGAGADSWGTCLSRDIKIVIDEVEGIALLPGWEKSRGARLEVCAALLSEKRFFYVRVPHADAACEQFGGIEEVHWAHARERFLAAMGH